MVGLVKTAAITFICIVCSLSTALANKPEYIDVGAPDKGPLSLTITSSSDPLAPDQLATIRLLATNKSNEDLTDVEVHAIVPEHVESFINARARSSCPGANCSPGETVTWSLGTLPAGGSHAIIMPAHVRQDAQAGDTITVTATVIAGEEITESTLNIPVVEDPPLAIALTPDMSSAVPGEPLTYTVVIANRSSVTASGIAVAVSLPEWATVESVSGNAVTQDKSVEWQSLTLEAGKSLHRYLSVSVDASVPDGEVLLTRAIATGEVGEARAEMALPVEANPSLAISVVANPDPIGPGEFLSVAITVTNLTSATIEDPYIYVMIPAYADNFIGRQHGWDGCGTHIYTDYCNVGTEPYFASESLPPGGSTRKVLPVEMLSGDFAPPAGSIIHLSTRVRAGEHGASTVQNVAVEAPPSVTLGMTVSEGGGSLAEAGSPIEYTLLTANRSDAPVHDALLQMPIPAGTSFVTASDGGTLQENVASWMVGTLGPGETIAHHLTLLIDSDIVQGSIIATRAGLTTSTGTARASSGITVKDAPDLILEVEATPELPSPRQDVTFTYTVTNNTSDPMEDIMVGAMIPDYISSVVHWGEDFSCRTGAYCGPGDVLFWEIEGLAPGESRPVSFESDVVRRAPLGALLNVLSLARVDDYRAISTYSTTTASATVTAVEQSYLPEALILHHNYPNPFRNATEIRYELPRSEYVRIKVFDITGRLVAVLVNDVLPAGLHNVMWVPKTSLPSGLYLYKLEAGSTVKTGYATVIK